MGEVITISKGMAMREVMIDLAVHEGFPAYWAEENHADWYASDEEISFLDWLYRLEEKRTPEALRAAA